MRNSYLLGLLGLVIGILAGYFLFHKSSPSFKADSDSKNMVTVNPAVDFLDFTPDTSRGGDRIDNAAAKEMVDEFKKEADRIWYPLRTQDGKDNLRGFFVRKEIFDTLINRNGCNGVRLYLAKHKGSPKHRGYTLVIVGTKPGANDPFKDLNGNIDDTDGGYYEEIDPCPNNCGSTVTNPNPLHSTKKK